jgi:thymidine phosphorylase
VGEIVRDLGGGRVTKEDRIDFDVGIDSLAEPGSRIQRGECLARIHAASRRDAKNARDRLETVFEISSRPAGGSRLIVELIG